MRPIQEVSSKKPVSQKQIIPADQPGSENNFNTISSRSSGRQAGQLVGSEHERLGCHGNFSSRPGRRQSWGNGPCGKIAHFSPGSVLSVNHRLMSYWGREWRETQASQSHGGERPFPVCRERERDRQTIGVWCEREGCGSRLESQSHECVLFLFFLSFTKGFLASC